MELKYKINSRILILLLIGAIMSCLSYLIFVYDPLTLIIKKVATLRPGSLFLKLWEVPPYTILIDTFIFNITNAEDFLAGKSKLKFEEVGPFVYQEVLINSDPSFNENGTMTFFPHRYLKFRRDLSIRLPQDTQIVTPNVPLLGITAALQDEGFFKNIAVSGISRALQSPPFRNLTVDEYLFGYDDQLVTLANKAIPSWINFERFGILDRLMALDNASNVATLNLQPEKELASPILTDEERHYHNHIHRFNGSPGLKQWGYIDTNETDERNTRCNMVEGSFDGTIFPTNFKNTSKVKIYRRAFCRPVSFHYLEKSVGKHGLDNYVFEIDSDFLEVPEKNPDNACYCIKGKCLPKGMASLAPCYYDIPITISQPHFYNADPRLLEQIDGMNPNKDLHNTNFTMHPDIGIVLGANLRIQINLDIGETKYNPTTKPFNGKVIPLFWLQLTLDELPSDLIFLLTTLFNTLPIVQRVIVYLLGIGGGLLMSFSAFFALFTNDRANGRLSFRGDYTPIPIIPMNSPYFKPDLKILK